MLSALDVLVLLKLCAMGRGRSWTQAQVASELSVSSSSVNAALKRAAAVNLFSPVRNAPNMLALEEALVHGARYFLGPHRGGTTRGTPTAWAAPPLVDLISTHDELPPVWPDPEGSVRGLALEPIYRTVPTAAKRDPALYELLALLDALREGGARERQLAAKELRTRLQTP